MTTNPVPSAYQSVKTAYELLPRPRRGRFVLVACVQVLLSLFDVIGVLLIAVVGVLAAQALQGQVPIPSPIELITDPFLSRGWDLREITFAFAILAALFLVSKSVFSGLLSRRMLIFLAGQQAALSTNLLSRFLNQPVVQVQGEPSQKTAFAIVQGATNAVVGILGSAVTVISEAFLLTVFALTLFLIDPVITLVAIAYLLGVGLVSYRILGDWSERVGLTNANTVVIGNTGVQDSINTFRELSVSGRAGLAVNRIRSSLVLGARAQADGALIGQIPKFVFESSLTVGAVTLAGFLFVTADPVTAIGTMIIFLAAGGRVLPSIMRLQSAIVTIRSSAGSSVATFDLASSLGGVVELPTEQKTSEEWRNQATSARLDFIPIVQLESVTYSYPESVRPSVKNVSLTIPAGSSLALVGPTGAGKSTLADVLLGALVPQSGEVRICDLLPSEATTRWPGGISYVPQQVSLAEASVRDNVALGLPSDSVDDELVWEVLEESHLADFLSEHREGLDTLVGERGIRLSGGQRQRLGLARALYTRPKLLVLDEATSALDAVTEQLIASTMERLHGETTLVVVAHRLATVRDFDCVAYLDQGSLVYAGSFIEVRANVREFDHQATILGID